MADIRSSLFGRLVMATGKVNVEQIQECLDLQIEYERAGQKVPRLGELLASKGYLTATQVREILRQQRDKNRRSSSRAADPIKAIARQSAGKRGGERSEAATSHDDSQAVVASDPGLSERRTSGEVFGQFKILKRLGADASGYTYKARYLPKDLVVTLRVLSQEKMAADPDYVREFEQKVKKATELRHPNIQRVVAAGRKFGRDFYAAEYVEGVSLRRVIEARGKLDPAFTVDIGIQLTQALEYGHAHGVFHQAIRPSNVMVCPDRTVKLVAFGVAHDVMGNLRRLAEAAGDTPFYVAPEQAIQDSARATCDARTDIYCLGVTLYHALTGEPPFKGESVEEVLLNLSEEEVPDPTLLNPDAPSQLADLVLSMMNPEPEKRYQTATHLLADLRAIATDLSAPQTGTRTFRPARKEESTEISRGAARRRAGARERRPGQTRGTGYDRGRPHRVVGREDTPVLTMVAGGAALVVAFIVLLYYILRPPPPQPPAQPAAPSPYVRTRAPATAPAPRQPAPRPPQDSRQPRERVTLPAPRPRQPQPAPRQPQPAITPKPGPAPKETPPVPTFLRDMHADN